MYRVAFAIDDSGDRHYLDAALRQLTLDGARIAAAFAGANTADIYLDVADAAVPRRVADQLAACLRVQEYELTRVDALSTGSSGGRRLGAITQVCVHTDARTVSVQVRHRPYERVDRLEVHESNDSIAIAAFVTSTAGDESHFVSLAIAFSWVDTVLGHPVGKRTIRRDTLDLRSAHDLSPEEILARLERLVERAAAARAGKPLAHS